MQDKLTMMDDQRIEDLHEDHSGDETPALEADSVPVIKITRFDDNDLPVGTSTLPLRQFL